MFFKRAPPLFRLGFNAARPPALSSKNPVIEALLLLFLQQLPPRLSGDLVDYDDLLRTLSNGMFYNPPSIHPLEMNLVVAVWHLRRVNLRSLESGG